MSRKRKVTGYRQKFIQLQTIEDNYFLQAFVDLCQPLNIAVMFVLRKNTPDENELKTNSKYDASKYTGDY